MSAEQMPIPTSPTTPATGKGTRGQEPISIVVPTYREVGNIASLIERITTTMSKRHHAWEVVIIDDDSDDETVLEAKQAALTLPAHVVVRRDGPRDLSRSVLLGISHAHHPVIVVMDADHSHRPEDIPALLEALERTNAPMVIASRYLQSAAIDQPWSTLRQWGSRVATIAARTLWPTSDPLSGFFAIRRDAIPTPETLAPIGYKIALEFGVRGKLRPAEVPIRFESRRAGESKMDTREVVRFAGHLARLARARHPRATRGLTFGCVALTGFVLDVSLYLALTAAGTDHRLARAISCWPAATWNWALNRRITFGDRPKTHRTAQWTRSVAANAVVNIGAYIGATTASDWFDAHRLITLTLGVGLGASLNFWLASTTDQRSTRARKCESTG